MVSAISAAVDHPRRRQISKSARQMRGAFWLTYIMSALRLKLSMRARVTYACPCDIGFASAQHHRTISCASCCMYIMSSHASARQWA